MGNLIIFSDLHSNPFKQYSTVTEDGTNSRLNDAISCIDQIREYAEKTRPDCVIFTGDLFDTRTGPDTKTLQKTYDAIHKFKKSNIHLYLLVGNHDMQDRAGKFHSLHVFKEIANVIDKPGWYVLQGKTRSYPSLCIPYLEDVENLKEIFNLPPSRGAGSKMFLGHMGVVGTEAGSNFVYRNPVEATIADLPSKNFDVGFLGHFHKHQNIVDNFWYVGAPLMHNWGDVGQSRGFLEYNTNTKELKQLPLNSPKFIEIDAVQAHTTALRGNYVRLVDSKEWSVDKKQEFAETAGTKHFDVIKPKTKEIEHNIRMSIDAGFSLSDVVEQYVSSGIVDLDDLEEDALIALGQEIVESVE